MWSQRKDQALICSPCHFKQSGCSNCDCEHLPSERPSKVPDNHRALGASWSDYKGARSSCEFPWTWVDVYISVYVYVYLVEIFPWVTSITRSLSTRIRVCVCMCCDYRCHDKIPTSPSTPSGRKSVLKYSLPAVKNTAVSLDRLLTVASLQKNSLSVYFYGKKKTHLIWHLLHWILETKITWSGNDIQGCKAIVFQCFLSVDISIS